MKTINLYPYQEGAKQQVTRGLSETGHSLLVMATGTGKTYTALSVLQDFWSPQSEKRVLVLAHTINLLDQLYRVITETFEVPLNFVCDGKYSFENKISVASFQTMYRLLEEPSMSWLTDYFDYVIVDEAHHAQASTYHLVLEQLGYRWILGMTATPERLDGYSIEDVFGPITVNIDIATSLAMNWLTPVRIKLYSCDVRRGDLDAIDNEIDAGRITSQSQLKQRIFIRPKLEEECRIIQEECGTEPTLVFCTSREHAQRVVDLLPRARLISYMGSTKENQHTLTAFHNGEFQYLVSINKLNEGVDIPWVKYAVSLRSTESQNIILHQLGRILRKYPNKEQAVFIDFVGNATKLEEMRNLQHRLQELEATQSARIGGTEAIDVNTPVEFVYSQETTYLLDLLDKVTFYQTLSEIRDAWLDVVRMHPEIEDTLAHYDKPEYRGKDTKLPSWNTLQRRFGLQSWRAFVGVEHYESLKEIRDAWLDVVRMHPEIEDTRAHYDTPKYRGKDPKLPAWETIQKRFGLQSWNEFTGKGGKRNVAKEPYSTLEEVREAWLAIVRMYPEVKDSIAHYHKPEYRGKDTKLPGWYIVQKRFGIHSWSEFTGEENYESLQEIREAWLALVQARPEIKDMLDHYKKSEYRGKDPKLPHWGAIKSKFGIQSWREFTGEYEKLNVAKESYSTLEEVREAWLAMVRMYPEVEDVLSHYRNPEHRSKDHKLPSWDTLKRRFGLQSWSEFTGKGGKRNVAKEPYSTLEEVREAWLAIVRMYPEVEDTLPHYQTSEYRNKDPKLSSWSTLQRRFGLQSWSEFTEQGGQLNVAKEPYSALEEVREAWLAIVRMYPEVKDSLAHYHKPEHRGKDPKLPGWYMVKKRFGIQSWREFTGEDGQLNVAKESYSTLEEVREAWLAIVRMYPEVEDMFVHYHNSEYRGKDHKLPSWTTLKKRFGIQSWMQFQAVDSTNES